MLLKNQELWFIKSYHEFEQALGDGEGQGSLACYTPWGHKSWAWLSDWNEIFNEYSGLISLDVLAVQGTLKSLLKHHSSKASILRHSAFFTMQLSYPYMTIGKTIALTRRTLVGKVMSLFLNLLSRLVITFLPRSKGLSISWLQSPSAVILEPQK